MGTVHIHSFRVARIAALSKTTALPCLGQQFGHIPPPGTVDHLVLLFTTRLLKLSHQYGIPLPFFPDRAQQLLHRMVVRRQQGLNALVQR